jgi:hypothetical protein
MRPRGRRIVWAVRQQRSERRHVLFEYHPGRLGGDVVYGGGERLASPDSCHSRISCERNPKKGWVQRFITTRSQPF